MRKSTIITILVLILFAVFAPVESEKTQGNFNDWRPTTLAIGCHSGTVVNEQVSGSIAFDPFGISVDVGEAISFNTTVIDFGGDLVNSDSDVSVGFNLIDGDNNEFLVETIVDLEHVLDTNGNSITPYLVNMTAPLVGGNYTLIAYAVAGAAGTANDYFHWVTGQLQIQVLGAGVPTPPTFNVTTSTTTLDIVTFDFDFEGATNIEKVEMSINGSDYEEITLVSNSYELNVTSFELGYYEVNFNITNSFDLSLVKSITFTIEEPIVTTDPTETSETSETPSSTQITTPTIDKELSPLASGLSVGILAILFLIIFLTPIFIRNKL